VTEGATETVTTSQKFKTCHRCRDQLAKFGVPGYNVVCGRDWQNPEAGRM